MRVSRERFIMFVFYHLFCRYVESTPSVPPSDPEKDRAILIWWAAFGFTLFFRSAAELVIRLIFFSTCTLLIGTLDGSLNLFVGHAVLRAANYNGYEPPSLSSLKAGSLGGITVIGPTTLATVSLITFLGGPKLQSALSRHITFLLELASAVAVCAAAGSAGVTILQRTRPDDGTPLDATHAARAGALGACIVTVPIISTAAFLMRGAQTMPSTRNEPSTPPPDLAGCPESQIASSPRTQLRRRLCVHTAAETAAYVVVILCVLTVRVLCF